jgi:hypothetical protein
LSSAAGSMVEPPTGQALLHRVPPGGARLHGLSHRPWHHRAHGRDFIGGGDVLPRARGNPLSVFENIFKGSTIFAN